MTDPELNQNEGERSEIENLYALVFHWTSHIILPARLSDEEKGYNEKAVAGLSETIDQLLLLETNQDKLNNLGKIQDILGKMQEGQEIDKELIDELDDTTNEIR